MDWLPIVLIAVVAVMWLAAVTFVLLFLKGSREDDDHTSS